MKLLAIDPGPVESAWLVYDTALREPAYWVKEGNMFVLAEIGSLAVDGLAVEMIASYGMAVGAEVFETCLWIGRFVEAWARRHSRHTELVFRRDVKMHLCGSPRAKDSNIRQALIDRYGPGKDKAIGLKASPGPLYGMSGDCWAALAVAVTAADTRLDGLEAAA